MLVNAYCSSRSLPPFDFSHTLIAQRDHSDPELSAHLDGFLGYIAGDGEEMTSIRYALLRHIQKVQCQVSLELETESMADFGRWLEGANGVAFLPDGRVVDPRSRTLFQPGGEADDTAALPCPADALARKQQQGERLAALGISVPSHLPAVISEVEVELRPATEVAERALALFVTAVRAESLTADDPIPVPEMEKRRPLAFEALSPIEKAFMRDPNPSENVTMPMLWRYESLAVLLWALGRYELDEATTIADAEALSSLMLSVKESPFLAEAQLRDTAEILDALDRCYRMHWAVRQADLVGDEPPAQLIPGVVYERHYALNWLVQFENAPWDEVDTPS